MKLFQWGKSRDLDRSSHSTIIRYTFLYILISVIWISLSDWLLARLASDRELLTTISIAKGWLFVAITALFWHGVMARNARMIMQHHRESETARQGEVKALQNLRQNEEKFKILFQHSPDGVVIVDPRTAGFVEYNEAAHSQLGYTREEFARLTVHDITVQDSAEETFRRIKLIQETGRHTFETLHRTKAGEIRNVYVTAQIVDAAAESLFFTVWRDVTELKTAELVTARHLGLIQFAHDHSLKEVLVQTLDYVGELTNSPIGFYHFVGPDQDTLMLQAWSTRTTTEFCTAEGDGMHYPVDQAGVWAECVHMRKPVIHNDYPSLENKKGLPRGHADIKRELVVPILRGNKIVAILGVGNKAVEYNDSEVDLVRYFADVAWEIVERKRADDERDKLQSQLVRAQRMEAIGTLSSGIAHDFNNILNVIMGNASLIESYPDDRASTLNRVDAIQKASRRAAQLVKQLLTFARKSEIDRRTINLNELVREIAKLLEETFPKAISIRLDLDPAMPSLRADPNQLHQVFLNLSVNARDAMPGGGEYTMATRVVPASELKDGVPPSAAARYGVVFLKDDGIGMDSETLKQIFDPFFTTKEIGKGTGLGLAVALGIVENHGGQINVSSSPGSGTEFRIALPLPDQADAQVDRHDSAGSAVPGGTETILFIEDEELIRSAMVESLKKKGYTVLTARDGEEGVEAYRENMHRIDIVLSDRGLPKIWGEEVWRQIQQMKPDVPFIMLTGYIEPQRKEELLKAGVRSIVNKPFTPVELLRKIREVLDPLPPSPGPGAQ